MLSADTAKERLKTFALPEKDVVVRRLQRITQLPTERMQAVAFGLLGRGADGQQPGSSADVGEATRLSDQAAASAAATFDEEFIPAEVEQVFRALLPGFAPSLAAFWQHRPGLYQSGYSRKPFRAPADHADLTRPARLAAVRFFVEILGAYEENDIVWLAAWAPYITHYYAVDHLGRLLAAAIDLGGDDGERVFEILRASGNGEHEIGAMGRHVTRALLTSFRPDGWDWVEKLLLAAQRQEGLRQTVLEAVDEAHPEAFARMLRLIQSEDLIRFSATIRALDIWFGFGWDAPSPRQASTAINLASSFLDDLDAARTAVAIGSESDAQTVFLALWSLAFRDAPDAIAPATALLEDPDPERRFAATHFLADLQLKGTRTALIKALDDPDLRVAARAFKSLEHRAGLKDFADAGLFERFEQLVPRFPGEVKTLGPIIWPWLHVQASREAVATALINAREDRPLSVLLPYLAEMSSFGRQRVALLYGETVTTESGEIRDVLLKLSSDASSGVRASALRALSLHSIGDGKVALHLEGLLTRKSEDTRRAVLDLLLRQNDAAVLTSASRLLGAKPSSPQRAAGLELLAQMVSANRGTETARSRASAYAAANPGVGDVEAALLQDLLDQASETATLDNALGLMDPSNLTPAVRPESPDSTKSSPAAASLIGRIKAAFVAEKPADLNLASTAASKLITAIDAFIDAHREAPVAVKSVESSSTEALLGSIAHYQCPRPQWQLPREEDRMRMPVFEQFEAWWLNRPDDLRDADGLETVRARVAFDGGSVESAHLCAGGQADFLALWPRLFSKVDRTALKHSQMTRYFIDWALRLFPSDRAGTVSLLLNGAEATLALIPDSALIADTVPQKQFPPASEMDWRYSSPLLAYLEAAREDRRQAEQSGAPWTDADTARLWRMLAWKDRPYPDAKRLRGGIDETCAAFRIGAATIDDLYDLVLGPPAISPSVYSSSGKFSNIRVLSKRAPHAEFAKTPELREVVDRCRTRILDVEVKRGNTPTAATPAAQALRHSGDAATLTRLLSAMGETPFARGWAWSENRGDVLSHLIRGTFPAHDDTWEAFAAGMKSTRISDERLVETALYAPQWARHVEAAIGWPQFADAVWWMHAHTKDTQWSVDQETRDAWAAEIGDKTPLTAQDLVDGAVDVGWFATVYNALGVRRWKALDEAAKYASSSGGHKRAQLYAEAMLGSLDRIDLVKRIREKRNQDAVRAFGLLPLPEGDTDRQVETLARYKIIQEFRRTSTQFGAQRQESEKTAARIGLENLARTAGYADPARLEWAMEAEAVADLKAGPVSATAGQTTVTLAIDDFGMPGLTFFSKGKVVKTLPAAAKKDAAIVDLVARRKEIERQVSRMRQSLEEAMCRGDIFIGSELARIFEHPVLQPMLRSLVFVADSGDGTLVLGYPVEAAASLEGLDDQIQPVSAESKLRIAHPCDLYATGLWDRWQQECFRRERIQPFKQVYRELYLLTETEKADGNVSRRYAGHQVNPKQALALLGRRGWINSQESGVRRTFHAEGLTVSLETTGLTFTPADVEGLTIEDVRFARRGEWAPIPLTTVPPRVFSEAMRDLDLVVSVAHQGGVDSEASASTVEMRAALVRETAQLLRLDNVRLQKSHVLVDGTLGTYSIHLGSAIVHRQPGGFVCIVPVHSQHRGRLFLPFVDDDPRTAEVVSKVLLLAKDQEIRDPTILEQLLIAR